MKTGISVQQAKRLGIILCKPDTTLLAAARRMSEEMISTLVVTDEAGALTGILTRTDILRACRDTENWTEQKVGDFMVRQVITVSPRDALDDVIDLLLDRHIHRVVVVHEEQGNKRPVAVVSGADIVYHLVKTAGYSLEAE